MNRAEQIKGYLKRLGDGESLENVKKDFVKEFNDVNPIEIMEAEQALIAEGTPISEVSKLCDVHSALFHGATKEERIAKAENEISEMKKYYDDTMKGMTKSAIADMRKDRESIFNKLAMISGHPLNTFVKENKAIQQVIDDIKENITSGHIDIKALKEKIYKLRELSIHYAKKGDLLYPVLNVRYKISGPSAVMWTVDDEIRDELSDIAKQLNYMDGNNSSKADNNNSADNNNGKSLDGKLIERIENVIKRAEEMIYKLRELSIHYAKKGDLLYPVLNVRYKISGPSAVMWTVDDEIRDELSDIAKQLNYMDGNNSSKADNNNSADNNNGKSLDGKLIERIENVIKRAEEMIYKEDNILYPNCAANFTEAEWIGIYHDSKDYAVCLDTVSDRWEKAEEVENVYKPEVSEQSDKKEDVQNELYMAGGHMTLSQLEALLNAIPMEITFVDEDNINRYFNEGSKVFKRPVMAIDREVFSCHPPKIEAKVRRIIEEFRIGTLDEVPVWMDKQGRTMLVKYIAVRDKQGNYVGTLEVVQDMEFAKEHFAKLK